MQRHFAKSVPVYNLVVHRYGKKKLTLNIISGLYKNNSNHYSFISH